MPLRPCTKGKQHGWRWGRAGKCYTGPGAKKKALKQAVAMGEIRNARRPLQVDPTRSIVLRRQFSQKVAGRFNKLRAALWRLVVVEDAFGLKRKNQPFTGNVATNTRYAFLSTPEQLRQFDGWLKAEMERDVLGGITTVQDAERGYWANYINKGYRKGAGRAFDDVDKPYAAGYAGAGGDVGAFFSGTRYQFLAQAFARPVARRKVELLAGRVYSDLKGVTEQMGATIKRELTDGLVRGESPLVVGRRLNKIVDGYKNRGKAIARTETIRAHAEGQLDAMEEMGVEEVGVMVEWSAAYDDRVCEICADLDGVVMPIKEAHGSIPVHPNAIFACSTLASYGHMEELVRAWYDGPAVVLLAGNKRTTIGPNHPVMTRRGMVPAAQIKEGDEILYDLRHNDTFFPEVNVKQVPTVEDVFEASVTARGYSHITRSGSDLHGDRMFCQDEVEAIAPARRLLIEWDSGGIEQFRKGGLVLADSQLPEIPRLGSRFPCGERVLLTAPGSMGCSDPRILANDWFVWLPVHHVSLSRFRGWAFDATTATSLYCSSGFVVSNCRCCFIPSTKGRRKEGYARTGRELTEEGKIVTRKITPRVAKSGEAAIDKTLARVARVKRAAKVGAKPAGPPPLPKPSKAPLL